MRNGEEFSLDIKKVKQDRINTDKVREILNAEQLKSVTNTITMIQKKVTRIKGEKPKFTMPNLGNMTVEGLIDSLGKVREEMKDLKKMEGIYSEALDGRMKAEREEAEKSEAVEDDRYTKNENAED